MSKCWQLTFKQADDKTLAFLEEYFSALTEDFETSSHIAYAEYFNEKDFLNQAEANGLKPKYKLEILESQNWLKSHPSHFPPYETEMFYICNPDDKHSIKPKISLKIYAETAFGFNHPTTRGCLQALEDLHKAKMLPQKILDIGTGSGILSLAAAKLWPEAEIIAVDIDRESVDVTKANVKSNGLEKNITAEISNGYHAAVVGSNKPYDLVLANILANPLVDMAHNLETHLKRGGFCILSGFTESQLDWVVKEHKKYYLTPVKAYEFEQWRIILMEKLK